MTTIQTKIKMAGEGRRSGNLKLYVDLLSQPARAVTIFCRVNEIEAEEVKIEVAKGGTRTAEYKNINPACKVPSIDDGGFKLHESHAILRYLAESRNVADHWYPKNLERRALIDSALDWHHTNLRPNAFMLVVHRVITKFPGKAPGIYPEEEDVKVAMQCQKNLKLVLDYLETVLLKEPGKFLENADEVSIADLSLVCEIKQLLWLTSGERKDLLDSRERLAAWIDAVEKATDPHFTDVHADLYGMAQRLDEGRKVQAFL